MAKKSKQKAAKRAAKKHEKQVKRQRTLAERRPAAPLDRAALIAAWRPKKEGIEGLARRLGESEAAAGELAEKQLRNMGRADVAELWLPSRLAGMSVDAVLAALAERGIVPDEAGFRASAEQFLSVVEFAEAEWIPRLAPAHTVHDRDLCRGAAARLWSVWAADICSEEWIVERLEAAERAMDADRFDKAVAELATLWRGLPPGGATQRLFDLGELHAFLQDTRDAVCDTLVLLPEADLRTLREALREVEEQLPAELAGDFHHQVATDAITWLLDGADACLDRLFEQGARDPGRVLDAAVMVLRPGHGTPALASRAIDAIEGVLPTLSGDLLEEAEVLLDDLRDLEAEIHEP